MIKKKFIYVLLLLLVLTLSGSLVAGLSISNKLANSSKNEYFWKNKETATSHLNIIIDDSNQTYDEAFEKGAYAIAEEHRIAIEITRIERSNYHEDVLEALDKAMYSKVDGIVLHSFNDEAILKKIIEISELGIPIITIDEDIPNSPRICYVGVNRYDVGKMAGAELAVLLGEKGKIAVIDQKGYDDKVSKKDEMMLLGLNETLKAFPDITVEIIKYTDQGLLSAETVANEILRNNDDITGIFCTDGENTLGVAQALIDNNMVNNVVLVGYGNEVEIIEYIQKGDVIEASIVTDHEDIGKEIVKAFYEYRINQFVSSFINTDIQIVSETNINNYLNEMSGANGQVE